MQLGLGLMRRNGGSSIFVPGTVPRVVSSAILAAGQDGILITFDRPMVFTPSLKEAVTIKVNGTTIAAKNIEADPNNPKRLVIIMNTPFKSTDVVTWAYNDQHPTEFLKGAEVGGVKADNQTYSVTNNIVIPPVSNDWVDENSNHWIDENTNNWSIA